jgi:hypothetical protein
MFGRLARWARVPPVPIHWHHPSGPHFGNMLARLELDGQDARVLLERAVWGDAGVDGERKPRIDITAELSLTDAAPPG